MNKRMLFGALAVAALVSVASTVAFTSPAFAGPFETAAAPFENYYGSQHGVPDFTFTKAEFGNTNLGAIVHLGAEVVYATVHGYTVVYNPATDEVLVWSGNTPEFKGRTIYADTKCELLPRGSGKWVLGIPSAGGGCEYDTLAGNAGGSVVIGVIGATERECTWTAKHEHSC